MERNKILINVLIDTLSVQDQHLTPKDKAEFPLMFRVVSAVNDIWNANKVPITKLDIEAISHEMVRIQINGSTPVTYIPHQLVPCHE